MLELLVCSLVTVLPDYLYRRLAQGKRIGHEITLFSIWYELRWGLTACLMLTIALITLIFYFHPSTTSATAFFRTVPILPEAGGRVAAVHVGLSEEVEAGQLLFELDDQRERAAVKAAERRIAEIDASFMVAEAELAATEGQIRQAEGALRQAQEELDTRLELRARNPDAVPPREIERLEAAADGRRGVVEAAEAAKAAVEARLSTLLPAQRASAEAELARAQVELDKTYIRAGTDGRVEQFLLREGDFVSPVLRPAGVLIPTGAGRGRIEAGFGQIEAQVMKVGMAAEITCLSRPFRVIPMVVTGVQGYIAAGQLQASQELIDPQTVRAPGSITVMMEPMFAGSLDDVPPGSSCIANAYTSNHEALASDEISTGRWLFLHVVDTVAVVHAILLRIQAFMLPIQTLVLSGTH